jgi:UDP-N-acetylmuramate dehydrogenase
MNWYDDFSSAVKLNEPLGPYTYMGVGGPAEYFVQPRSEGELAQVVRRLAAENIPFRVLGAGANVLVDSEGLPGAVVRLSKEGFGDVRIEGARVRAGAGANFPSTIYQTVRAGLAGLETLVGIPAQVGGAVRMNCGGAFGDIGRLVQRVKVMDGRGEVYWLEKDDLVFEYRRTNIGAPFVLEAEFALAPDHSDRIVERMRKVWMYKNSTQPLAAFCAGCIFKNPPGGSAGKLIDECGLKGAAVGRATVSAKHANYIVVEEGADSRDVLNLIEMIRERVHDRFNIMLETEIKIWQAEKEALRV